jgi:hypothetical protein
LCPKQAAPATKHCKFVHSGLCKQRYLGHCHGHGSSMPCMLLSMSTTTVNCGGLTRVAVAPGVSFRECSFAKSQVTPTFAHGETSTTHFLMQMSKQVPTAPECSGPCTSTLPARKTFKGSVHKHSDTCSCRGQGHRHQQALSPAPRQATAACVTPDTHCTAGPMAAACCQATERGHRTPCAEQSDFESAWANLRPA